ncbi:MAG: DUF4349 domain-containing protein [Acidimicrobiales bacterium]
MTMIDEDRIRSLFGQAADSFDIPQDGVESILSAAATTDHRDPVTRPVVPRRIRRRVVLVAAAVVAVAVGIGLIGGSLETSSRHSVAGGPSVATPAHIPSPPGAGPTFGAVGGGSSGSANTGQATPPSGATAPSTTPASLPTGVVGQSAKVETTGTVDLTIGNRSLNSVATKLSNLASGVGGFVAKSQLQVGSPGGGDPSYGTVVLQVPQPSFGSVLAQVQGFGKVTSVTSTSTDVTGQYVNLQARITALQDSLQQYLTILSRATSIGDILSVQNQIDTIQSEIEQLQGQLNLLDSQTTYGSLTVSLSEVGHPPPPPPPPISGLASAWHDSVSGFVSGFEWLIRIAGPTLFVLLLLTALVVAGRWTWRASRRRML